MTIEHPHHPHAALTTLTPPSLSPPFPNHPYPSLTILTLLSSFSIVPRAPRSSLGILGYSQAWPRCTLTIEQAHCTLPLYPPFVLPLPPLFLPSFSCAYTPITFVTILSLLSASFRCQGIPYTPIAFSMPGDAVSHLIRPDTCSGRCRLPRSQYITAYEVRVTRP